MDTRLKPLFTPWKIGNCEIKNRIVLTSMGGTDLLGWMENNHFDKDGARFIMEVAKNNVGLLLPGCQPVYNPMFGQWLHKNKKMYKDLAEWMPQFHQTGAKLFVQLTAGFGRSFTVSKMMEMLYNTPVIRTISKPIMDLDRITASASPSPNRWSDKLPSREMTKDEIKEMDEYVQKKKVRLCYFNPSFELWFIFHLGAPGSFLSDITPLKGKLAEALPGYEFTPEYLLTKGLNMHIRLFPRHAQADINARNYNAAAKAATGLDATIMPLLNEDITAICGSADMSHNQKVRR